MFADDLSLTYKQKHDLGILFHTLYSNPRILYSPNNTQINRVIQKVNSNVFIDVFICLNTAISIINNHKVLDFSKYVYIYRQMEYLN